MGIQKLLETLKPCMQEAHLKDFRGQTAAVDIMVWLYKGAYTCCYELGKGQATIEFLLYPIKMLRLLKNHQIKPICVFDGLHLKAKADTEKERASDKKKNRDLAFEHDRRGETDQARKLFSRSLVLRTKMIDLFQDILRELSIDFIVAPYEADAQISYLVKQGTADFAISEDSDLIAYGCPKLLLKLNPLGCGELFSFDNFYSFKAENDKNFEIKALQDLPKKQFIYACIMAGCEYLSNIERVGLKVTLKHFMQQDKNFEKVIKHLKAQKTYKDRIEDAYIDKAKKVLQLFMYQTVYDMQTLQLTYLNELPGVYDSQGKEEDQIDFEYLGSHDPITPILSKFTAGQLKKSSWEERELYMGNKVIDMSKVRMDYFRNDISQHTLQIIDNSFFEQIQAVPAPVSANDLGLNNGESQAPEQQDFAKLSERLTDQIQSAMCKPIREKVEKVKVNIEQLGFGMSSDSELESPPVKNKSNNSVKSPSKKSNKSEFNDTQKYNDEEIIEGTSQSQERRMIEQEVMQQSGKKSENYDKKSLVNSNKKLKSEIGDLASLCENLDKELEELSKQEQSKPIEFKPLIENPFKSTPKSKQNQKDQASDMELGLTNAFQQPMNDLAEVKKINASPEGQKSDKKSQKSALKKDSLLTKMQQIKHKEDAKKLDNDNAGAKPLGKIDKKRTYKNLVQNEVSKTQTQNKTKNGAKLIQGKLMEIAQNNSNVGKSKKLDQFFKVATSK